MISYSEMSCPLPDATEHSRQHQARHEHRDDLGRHVMTVHGPRHRHDADHAKPKQTRHLRILAHRSHPELAPDDQRDDQHSHQNVSCVHAV
jgi:hypothetical protein